MIRTEARGQTGTVVFDGEFVTITRTGLSRLTTGRPSKRIAIADISSVEVRPAGPVVSGYLRFLFPGVGPSAAGAANDENAVVFTKRQAPSFETLRAAVDDAIGRGPVPSHDGSVADELTKLARLIELELLTREEFEAAKAKLLGA